MEQKISNQLLYTVVSRKNLQDKTKPAKFYALVKTSGKVNLYNIAEKVQVATSLAKSDVIATFVAIEDEIKDALSNGRSVQLGSLGTFRIGIGSTGAAKAADFKASAIKRPHILFRASTELKAILGNLSYSKSETVAKTKTPTTDGGKTDTGKDTGKDLGNSGEEV